MRLSTLYYTTILEFDSATYSGADRDRFPFEHGPFKSQSVMFKWLRGLLGNTSLWRGLGMQSHVIKGGGGGQEAWYGVYERHDDGVHFYGARKYPFTPSIGRKDRNAIEYPITVSEMLKWFKEGLTDEVIFEKIEDRGISRKLARYVKNPDSKFPPLLKSLIVEMFGLDKESVRAELVEEPSSPPSPASPSTPPASADISPEELQSWVAAPEIPVSTNTYVELKDVGRGKVTEKIGSMVSIKIGSRQHLVSLVTKKGQKNTDITPLKYVKPVALAPRFVKSAAKPFGINMEDFKAVAMMGYNDEELAERFSITPEQSQLIRLSAGVRHLRGSRPPGLPANRVRVSTDPAAGQSSIDFRAADRLIRQGANKAKLARELNLEPNITRRLYDVTLYNIVTQARSTSMSPEKIAASLNIPLITVNEILQRREERRANMELCEVHQDFYNKKYGCPRCNSE